VNAFILAAGFGTRLRPITDYLPKALVPVCSVPLLQRQIDFLVDNGFWKIGANVHYLSDQVFAFSERHYPDLALYHEQGSIRGTGGAFDFARDFLTDGDSVCVMNVDILSDLDLRTLARRFHDSDASCALVAASPKGKGTVVYDRATGGYRGIPSNCTITLRDAVADYVGVAFYRREFIDLVRNEDFSIVPVWTRAAEAGLRVEVMVAKDARWYDTGTPQTLARVHFDVLDGLFSLPVPEHMTFDSASRSAWHERLGIKGREAAGQYAWLDSTNVAEGTRFDHAIVFPGCSVGGDRRLRNVIVTPWGEVPFE
jgi:NDP-sugar pyrophosphorylase family protein